MIRPLIRLKRRRILLDIDTQRDLFIADGSACVRNHRRVLQNIRRINAWARKKRIKSISTAVIFSNGQRNTHDYCRDGTAGAEKIPYTMRSRFIRYGADGYCDLDRNIFSDYDQVILEKRNTNPFDEPRVERMLSELAVDEVIITGALVEDAVFETVLGLLQRQKRVTIVTDAIGSRDKASAETAMKKMAAKGARLIETKDLAGVGHLVKIGICHCSRCQGEANKVAV